MTQLYILTYTSNIDKHPVSVAFPDKDSAEAAGEELLTYEGITSTIEPEETN